MLSPMANDEDFGPLSDRVAAADWGGSTPGFGRQLPD